MATREENIKRFEELTSRISRPGIESLMKYVREKTDFYTAPASTKFHLSCEGGLLQHSLNVYDCLVAKKESPIWKDVFAKVSDESLIIMALFHDLCKVNMYNRTTRNQKTYDSEKVNAAEQWQRKTDSMGTFIWETVPAYEIKEEMPLGHGEKSAIMVNSFLKLTTKELLAIRWHMGYTEDRSQYNAIGNAMEMEPITLALYEADLEASKLLEDTDGNKE